MRLVEVGHGEPDVVEPAQPRQRHRHLLLRLDPKQRRTSHRARVQSADARSGFGSKPVSRWWDEPKEPSCPSTTGWRPPRPGSRWSPTAADWDAADPGAAAHDLHPAGAGSAPSSSTSSSSPAPGWSTGRRTRASARRAAPSARCSRSPARTRSTARTAATTSSSPRRCTTSSPRAWTRSTTPSDEVRDVLLRTLAEICGLDRGWSHGRGGSMHLQWKEAGAMGTNAIVGGGVPQAAGFAWSHRQVRHRRGVGDLLRRRRRQHRLDPGVDEPRGRLVAAGLLLHREQPVRRLHLRRRGDRRAAAVRARAGLRHRRAGGSTGWTRWRSTSR